MKAPTITVDDLKESGWSQATEENVEELVEGLAKADTTEVRGVAAGGKVKHWTEAVTTTDGPDFHLLSPAQQEAIRRRDAAEAAEFQAHIEAKREAQILTRRSPRERMAILTEKLAADYKATGTLPPSILRQVQEMAWAIGLPVGVDAIEEYAKSILEKTAQQHAETNGHRNDGVTVLGGIAS